MLTRRPEEARQNREGELEGLVCANTEIIPILYGSKISKLLSLMENEAKSLYQDWQAIN